jgi:hypothetical protein
MIKNEIGVPQIEHFTHKIFNPLKKWSSQDIPMIFLYGV